MVLTPLLTPPPLNSSLNHDTLLLLIPPVPVPPPPLFLSPCLPLLSVLLLPSDVAVTSNRPVCESISDRHIGHLNTVCSHTLLPKVQNNSGITYEASTGQSSTVTVAVSPGVLSGGRKKGRPPPRMYLALGCGSVVVCVCGVSVEGKGKGEVKERYR